MRTAILVALLLVVPGLALAGGSEEAAVWRLKADEPLVKAFDAGQDPLTIVVQGPPIPDPVTPPADRSEWRAHWDAHASAFLDATATRAQSLGGQVTNEFAAVNAAFVTLPNARLPSLLSQGDIRLAALDWDGAVQIVGADSLPGVTAELPDTITKVQAQGMWGLGYQGEGITLAVIDTGIRSTHEMLRNADGTTRVTKWSDHTTNPGGPGYCENPCDTNGHGTHVATTAAGSNLYNPNSPQGVAPLAEVWGVRIFQGGGGQWEWGQAGLQWAFDEGADITTNSWGGGCSGAGLVTAELAETLQNAGMMNVFAAGNSGFGGVLCPGMVENVITVGGIDVNDNIYGSSSRGPCTWPIGSGNTRICPDVNAVAVNVVAGWHTSDTAYQGLTGTSMATPHVAGVVVLLEEAKRDVTGDGMSAPDREAEFLLRDSARDLGPAGPDNDFGWGTAQAVGAYNLLPGVEPIKLLDVFSIAKGELRGHETGAVAFILANLGSGSANGHVIHKLEQISWGECPGVCYEQVVSDQALALAPGEDFTSRVTLDGGALPAGEYRVTASYAFDYVEGSDVESVVIEREGFFSVKKVDLRVLRGHEADAFTGEVLFSGVVLHNLGNEDATDVRFHETYRSEGFAPVAPVPPGAGHLGVFANPAPDRVGLDQHPVVRYEFNSIGDIESLAAWEASYNFLVGQPGEYEFKGTLSYEDEVGTAFTLSIDQLVTVSLPAS